MKKIYILFLITAAFISVPAGYSYADKREAAMHNEDGVKALNEGKYRQAIEHLTLALKGLPENPVVRQNLSNAYYTYAKVLIGKGETLNAIDNFQKSLKYNEKNIYSMIDLGRAYYTQNNLKAAIECFNRAYSLDQNMPGLKDILEKAEREVPVESGLDKLETMHFIIMKEQGINVDNLANIRVSLEQAYSRVGAFLDHYPTKKIGVILYPEQAYAQLNQGRPYWAHAHFDGKIRIPIARTEYSEDFLRRIIYHEYAHAVVGELTRGNHPIWLNEGISCYAEGLVVPMDRDFLTQYITAETFVPFDRLPGDYSAISDHRAANLFYREFYLLVSFIVERYGNRSLRDILGLLGKGHNTAYAIQKAMSISVENFSDSWQSYVKTKLGL